MNTGEPHTAIEQPEESATSAFISPPAFRPTIVARRWAVSTGHPLATEAALRILARGGNAIDAGVAAGVCLNVVQPDWTNFGGVAPIMAHTADGTFSIAGLGHWPRATDVEMLRTRFGTALPVGVLRTVVPAAAGAWLVALERFGTLPLSTVIQPALELAEEGFAVYPMMEKSLAGFGHIFQRWASTREVYWPQGRPPRVGEWLRQRDLARTLRRLVEAEAGATGTRAERVRAARDRFYRGDIADEIVRFVRGEGGWLSDEDMADFEPEVERPPSIYWRDWEVFACGPWSQGPVMLQALNMLAGDDFGSADGRAHHAGDAGLTHAGLSADAIHLIAESLNLAFADREAYYADPRYTAVPLEGLLSMSYARAQRRRIDARHAFGRMPEPGDPWAHQADSPRATAAAGSRRAGGATADARGGPVPGDTSYLCVVDAAGNAFSATPSDTLAMSPIVPGLGLVASPRGVQSRLDPDHPSAIAPGRRPRLTPNPALARRSDGTVLAFGTPGGDVQCQAMLQFFVNVAQCGMDLQPAIEAPRFASLSHPNSFYPHEYVPGLLRLEARIPETVGTDLAGRGHRVERWSAWDPEAGAVCAAVRDPGEPARLRAGADPRRMAYAGGW